MVCVCDFTGIEEGFILVYSVSRCCPSATESLCACADLQFSVGHVLQCVSVSQLNSDLFSPLYITEISPALPFH